MIVEEDGDMKELVLFLEDDPVLGEGLKLQLELASFEVRWCKTVREGVDAFQREGPFALALLDVNLPDGTGMDLCDVIREKASYLPVIFLTAKTDEDSVVKGFEKGASDYLRKPVGRRELLARINNVLPARKAGQDSWRYADLALSKSQRKLMCGEKEVSLNRREYEIMTCLMQNPESVISRERLLEEIDRGGEIFDRTIDSHVSHIRTKLRKAGFEHVKIESVYGEGYRLGTT